ncbi:hemolysin family protein [Actinopolymorpha alba]|uniref:hemolysin family protein n=1 Tax=Actinopolymorpha alba TaxID=533267 RepID=UPI00037A40AA|nr:hemolysin family protein [Actinopolymorpha alba]
MSNGVALLVALVLLAGNAFFVGAEFALVSVRRSQIEPLVEKGSRRARATMWAIRRVSLMMAGAQLGITLCTVGLGAVAEPAVAHLLEPAFHSLGLPAAAVHPVALTIALVIVVALHVVIGEMVPKNLALAAPDEAALALGPVLGAMVRAIRPVISALNGIANALLWLVRVTPRDEVSDAVTHEEVGHLLAESRREGLLDPDEHRLTAEALSFAERTASDVVIPLDSVVLAGPDTTPAEIEALAASTGHSRFPRRDERGDLSGYVHLKDVLAVAGDQWTWPVPAERIRPLPAIPATTPLVDVLAALRNGASHLARIDDEQGTTIGILTLDDVLLNLVPSRHPQGSEL